MRNTKPKDVNKYLDISFSCFKSTNLNTHLKEIEIQSSRKIIVFSNMGRELISLNKKMNLNFSMILFFLKLHAVLK